MARRLTTWLAGLALIVAVVALVGCAVSTSILPIKIAAHPGYTAGTACDSAACHDTYKHKEPYLGPCESCHTLDKWRPAVYSHKDGSFDNGMHPLIGCAMCHTEGEPLASSECSSCHDAPHAGSATCVDCHTTTAWGMRKPLPEGHVSLLGGHSKLECFDCHTSKKTPVADRTCVDCHGSNHGGLRACQDCHAPVTGWAPKAGWSHNGFFKITGKHRALDCTDCHKNGRFANTPKVCVGCHGKQHGGLTNCASCHTTAGFKPTTFRHSSVFALTGRHAKINCTACHRVKDRNLVAYAKVLGNGSHRCTACHGTQHGNLTNCASCHTTAGFENTTFNHAAVFPRLGVHATLACSACHLNGEFTVLGTRCVDCHGGASPHGAGTTQCQNCHTPVTTTGFKRVTAFSHPIPLGGAHAATNRCTRCHPSNVFTAATTACTASGCHVVPHVGPTACTTCHTPTAWATTTFTHVKVGNYHNSTDFGPYPSGCIKCHPNEGTKPNFVRYGCCHV